MILIEILILATMGLFCILILINVFIGMINSFITCIKKHKARKRAKKYIQLYNRWVSRAGYPPMSQRDMDMVIQYYIDDMTTFYVFKRGDVKCSKENLKRK